LQTHRLIWFLALAVQLGAQGNNHAALAVKEAERLALNAPPTLDAAQGACCPHADGNAVEAGDAAALYTLIWIQVRCACTEYAGQLIDNYTVNPKNGSIWQGMEETGVPLTSDRLDVVRQAIFNESLATPVEFACGETFRFTATFLGRTGHEVDIAVGAGSYRLHRTIELGGCKFVDDSGHYIFILDSGRSASLTRRDVLVPSCRGRIPTRFVGGKGR
jgi:hypothetical protein